MKLLKSISLWLATYTSPFIIAIAIVAFVFPESFAWVQQGQRASVILGLIMLTMGCTLSANDFRILLERPTDILIGTLAQFSIMPLAAWALSQIFNLDPYLAIGIILVGSCPGGVSSNIMSFLCHGDVAFSVGMTTVSTLLAPFVTPLLVLWLAGAEINVDAYGMFLNILIVTIIPIAAGISLNYVCSRTEKLRKWNEQTLRPLLPGASVICLAMIVGGVIFTVSPQLRANGLRLILITLAVVTCHNGLGYLLGYCVGKLFRFSTAKKRTICIEVGMQNAGMATVLSRNFFATPAIIATNPAAALAVFPCAISCAYHSISGTLIAGAFLLADKRKADKKKQRTKT